jgi:Acetylornithine deacetylase/Succinyl-diaminopimelate desuccinylase and related deacylases
MNVRRLLFIAPVAAFVLYATPLTAAELSATEQKIVAAIKERSDAALKFLEQTVNVNSGTMNHDGVREVGKMFRMEFDQLGFATRWAGMSPTMQRAGHLIATREGKQGKRLLLIGHLDTVFEKDSPVQLWDRNGERVRGQGVSDMKGGNVIIIDALRALQTVGALDNTTISVVFTGDEERVGEPIEIARADLIDAAKRSDIALAFEGTVRDETGQDTATIGRRASSFWTLQVTGKQGHSADVFSGSSGYGAVYETARILNTFREQLIEPDLTFNAAVVLGGTEVTYDHVATKGTAYGKSNVIAKSATVKGDLRYLTNEQRDRTHQRMREIVAASLSGTSAQITFHEAYPAMSPTPGNLRVLQMYSQASSDAGLGVISPLPPGQRGAGDVQFVAPYLDSLDGIGATGSGAHSPNEDLVLASIERAAIRAAITIYRLTR